MVRSPGHPGRRTAVDGLASDGHAAGERRHPAGDEEAGRRIEDDHVAVRPMLAGEDALDDRGVLVGSPAGKRPE